MNLAPIAPQILGEPGLKPPQTGGFKGQLRHSSISQIVNFMDTICRFNLLLSF